MIEKLESLNQEFQVLEHSLADPQLISQQQRYRTTMQRYSELQKVIEVYQRYKHVLNNIQDAEDALSDSELAEMAKEELIMLR